MASKTYRFEHGLGKNEARKRIQPMLDELCRKYGLEYRDCGNDTCRLSRTGVDVIVAINENSIDATVDLNWLLEKTIREKLEDRLHQQMMSLLL